MKYQWQPGEQQDGVDHILRLRGMTAEGWVIAKGDAFEVALLDLEGQIFLWTAEYSTLASAKRGLIAAAKRLGYIPTGEEQDSEAIVPSQDEQSPRSIWEWDAEILSYATWIQGDGVGIDGVVTPLADGTFEGDVVVGVHVFRMEYPDELSAKRGVLTRAKILAEQAVAI